MFIYLFLFGLASILYFKNPYSRGGVIFLIFIVSSILIAGFRDMIGGYDIYIYSYYFEIPLGNYNLLDFFEKGFVLYYRILRIFNDDRTFMIFMSSLIILGIYCYYLKKLSIYFYFSIFIFFCKFYLMSFVYIRQGLAMIFCLIAVYHLINKKRILMISFAVAAFFIHKSSIIFLPFIFVSTISLSYIQIVFLGLTLVFLSLSPLGNFLVENVGQSVGSEKVVQYSSQSGLVNVFYFIEGILVLGLALVYRNEFYKNLKSKIIINGLLFYGFIILFSTTNATFVRLSWYYFIFVCLGLPLIYVYTKKPTLKGAFRNAVFVYYSALFFRLLILYDGGDFMPYKSL